MVNYELEHLFYNSSVKKDIKIQYDGGVITNSDIFASGIDLEESICSEDEIFFGAVESSMFKITVRNTGVSFIDKTLNVSIILDNNTSKPFVLGAYKVISDKPTADKARREIVAYDALYDVINADVKSWYDGLFPQKDSSMTLKQFRNSFFSHFGITQVSASLINDGMTVTKTVDASEISGKDVLCRILEINGCLGRMTRDGKFKYISFDDVPATKTLDLYTSASNEDFKVKKITKLQIRTEENDIGVVVGSGKNGYIIEDNFLLYGKTKTDMEVIANNVLNVISNIQYYPASVSTKGNPCIECGDVLRLTTRKGVTFNTIVLQRTLKGSQALKDEYRANGKEYRAKDVNSVHRSVLKLKGRTNTLERTLDATISTISNLTTTEQVQSMIQQTADSITLQVSNLQQQIDGNVTTFYTDEKPTLDNYPAWDFGINIPVDGSKAIGSDEDALDGKGLRIDTTEDALANGAYKKKVRTVVFDKKHNIAYRFLEKDGAYVWTEIGDSEYTNVLQQISTISQTAEKIQLQVQRIETNGITRKEAQSLIEQTASQIMLSVEQTYTTQTEHEKLKAELKLQADQISATVSQTGGNSDESFTWSLKSNRFSLKSNGKEVFRCDPTGITVSGYTKTSTLEANYLTASEISANYLKTSKISTIELSASQITSGKISADRIDVGSIKIGNANITSLDAGKITTGTISTSRLNVNELKSNLITANNILSTLQSPTQGTLSVGSCRSASFSWWDGGSNVYRTMTPKTVVIGGITYHLLGY